MFDVLLIAMDDFANTGWKVKRSLETGANLSVFGMKGARHAFIYPDQLPIVGALSQAYQTCALGIGDPRFNPYFNLTKICHFMHSCFVSCEVDKPFVLQHGGANYRTKHEEINKSWGAKAAKTVIQMPDLLGLGAVNEVYIPFPVDTDFLSYTGVKKEGKLTIGHFPSASAARGTEKIAEVLKELSKTYDFEYVGPETQKEAELQMWLVHLERVKKCDIIIENLCSTAQDRKWGEWGNTAFEAASMGKVCVTNSLGVEKYIEAYKRPPQLEIANTQEDLENRLAQLLSKSRTQLMEQGWKARHWVMECHSFEATGKRYWEEVYKDLL